jgi:hypothetical protein
MQMEQAWGHANQRVSTLVFYVLLKWNHTNVAYSVYQGYMPHVAITPWNGRNTRNTIYLQHTKNIIVDFPKYSIPQ